MKRGVLLLAYFACAVACGAAEWPGFSRGIGIGGWLTNYKRFNVLPQNKRLTLTEGDFAHFDSYITEGDIEHIKFRGFDHVRLGFDQIVIENPDGTFRERTFARLKDFTSWCRKHGLRVVLNMHKARGNYCDIAEDVSLLDDASLRKRFVAFWVEMEKRFADEPDVAFELLNEVRDVDPGKWNTLADETVRALRALNPVRWIVIGPRCWNAASALDSLRIWDDPRIVYTFHMYDPFLFTHQRGVLQPDPLYENADVPFPGVETVERALAPAAAWAKAHPDKILWNGEFGTIRHMRITSRVAYMRAVTDFCIREKIPYCVWNYLSTPNDGNRFSLVDDDTRDFLSPALLDACLGRPPARDKRLVLDLAGDGVDRPACLSDLALAARILRDEPDVAELKNVSPAMRASRLFGRLAPDYDIVGADTDKPVLLRKGRTGKR